MADRIINMILPALRHFQMLGYWTAFLPHSLKP
jgi:hypothetical protein